MEFAHFEKNKMEKSKKLDAPVRCIVCNYQLLKINGKTNVEIKCQRCGTIMRISSTNDGYDTIILRYGKNTYKTRYLNLINSIE